MKNLDELLLLWHDQALSEEELAELKRYLATPEGRAQLADEFLMTAIITETLKAEAALAKVSTAEPPKPSAAAPVRRRRRLLGLRLAVAAALLVAVGLGAWLLFFPQPEETSPPQAKTPEPLLEQLVDWNLSLSEAPDLKERQRIYEAQKASLEPAVAKANLPAEESQLAALLLDNAAWLAEHNDPLHQAERLTLVADTLADQVQAWNAKQNAVAAQRFNLLHQIVVLRGVKESLRQAEKPSSTNKRSPKPDVTIRVREPITVKPGQDIPRIRIQRSGGMISVISRHADGRFIARTQGSKPALEISGRVMQGKVQVEAITLIEENSKTTTYASVEEVPEPYRAKVQKLIERSAKEPVKLRIGVSKTPSP